MTIILKAFKNIIKTPVQGIVTTKRITDYYCKTSARNDWLIS